MREEADALLLSYRWFSAHYLFLLLFCIVWDAFLVGWYSTAFTSSKSPGLAFWFPLGHVAVGIALTYATIAGLLNTTTVRASRDLLTIHHGPIPWLGSRSIQSSLIRQVYVEQVTTYWSTRSRSTHVLNQVSAVMQDNSKQKLLRCEDADVALFIEQQVERHLGIADRRVTGEMQK